MVEASETPAAPKTQELEFKDPNQATIENTMCKVIEEMPAELQDRFKAMMMLY